MPYGYGYPGYYGYGYPGYYGYWDPGFLAFQDFEKALESIRWVYSR